MRSSRAARASGRVFSSRSRPPAATARPPPLKILHCASLVHDDMPCFDDSATRRGAPSVHVAYGQPLALLTGDALIVLAFETLARECADAPDLLAPLTATLARAVGMPNGIVAGQAWESETEIDLKEYHRAKTASLFTGAVAAGAIAARADPQPWLGLGETLGAAYQVADDLRDMVASEAEMGKPCRQDAEHARPNAAAAMGVAGAKSQLVELVQGAVRAIPDCPGADQLKALIQGEAQRLAPKDLASRAA